VHVTFIPGAFFANAYNSREQVNKDLHDGLAKVSEMIGDGYRPRSVVAGFLSSANPYKSNNRLIIKKKYPAINRPK
jgi:hypothetical protein